jgi:sterol desaturase/sphingolipid hydroxylase (fatty acid hydroxylase superfamily)
MEATLGSLPPLILAASFAILWTIESALGARSTVALPRRRARNLALSAGNFVIGGISGAAVGWVAQFATEHGLGLLAIPGWPLWINLVAGVLLVDLAEYWRHRISHSIPALWRLHRVHHSDPVVDVTTSMRNHPLEMMLRPAFLAAAAIAFGLTPLAMLIYTVVQLPVLLFQHVRVTLPDQLDRMLRLAIVTPAWHLLHHSQQQAETDSHYATFLTIWDRLFASCSTVRAPEHIGLTGYNAAASQTLRAMLSDPWVANDRRSDG